jgi:HPt (histidine-containing phosphotransfer) domain-containing protein
MSGFHSIDLDGALERVGGDFDVLREVAGLFLEESPKLLAALQQALRTGDASGVARAAHNLKGCVSTFCAQQAYEAARALETAGRSENLSQATRDLARLSSAIEALAPELLALSGAGPRPAAGS